MARLRTFFDSTSAINLRSSKALVRGQVLAISASLGALSVELALRPLAHQALYLISAFALLASAITGGARSALTATVVLTLGGYLVDGAAGAPLPERMLRAALFLALGLVTCLVTQRMRPSPVEARPQAPETQAAAERRSEELHAELTQAWSQNSMGEMASVLAHELNQPLTAVTNYLRAARTLVAKLELEDDDLIEALGRAGDQAIRAGEIVRTMRDLATRGGTHLQPQSLSSAIREIEFILGLIARDSDVKVTYDLYSGHDIVLADKTQIQQLVVNLTRNAIEAVTKYPDRRVKISTQPDPSGSLLITVEDSGPGLDPNITDRLFQPLASTKPDGMGLGLSISSAIVHNHRGRIWVEPSRLGGAAFCFVLARAGNDGEGASVRTHGVRRR